MCAARLNVDSPRDYSVQLDLPDLKNPRNSIPVKNDPAGTRVYLNSLIVLSSGRMIFGIACINPQGEHLAMEESKAVLRKLGEAGLRNVTVDAIKVGGERVRQKIRFIKDRRGRVNSIPEAEEEETATVPSMDKLSLGDGSDLQTPEAGAGESVPTAEPKQNLATVDDSTGAEEPASAP